MSLAIACAFWGAGLVALCVGVWGVWAGRPGLRSWWKGLPLRRAAWRAWWAIRYAGRKP